MRVTRTVLVSGSDSRVAEAAALLRAAGDDVAVVGVDDIAEASFAAPTLSTVAIDRTVIAEAALDLLLRRLEGDDGPPRTVVAPHRLVVRESTCG